LNAAHDCPKRSLIEASITPCNHHRSTRPSLTQRRRTPF
jgi:hypothetical protein